MTSMLPRCALLVVVALLAGCGSRPPAAARRTAPEPGGCYVEVFDQPDLAGASDFINGPARHFTLRDLPFRADWHNRIRSLRVGPGATLTAWARDGFQGDAFRSGPDRTHRTLPEAFTGKIASLQITCEPQPSH
jgi:hypothetical protein